MLLSPQLYVPAGRIAPAGATTTLDPANTNAHITLSGGNLVGTCNTNDATGNNSTRSVASHASGKYYCEVTRSGGTGVLGVGINSGTLFSTGCYWYGNGQVFINGSLNTTIQTHANGNTLCVAVDLDNKTIWFRTNGGNWNNSGTANPATNTGGISLAALGIPAFAAFELEAVNLVGTANFGGSAYAQSVPSGFGSW